MITTLKTLIFLIGLVALGTGLNVLLGGSSAVPGFSGPIDPAIDNELRFFSVFWLAFAGLCLWVPLDVDARNRFIPWIALTFCLGGVARLISVMSEGDPGAVLIAAMIAELLLPLLILFAYLKAKPELAPFDCEREAS